MKNLKFIQDTSSDARLDVFLHTKFAGVTELKSWTRSQIKNLITDGKVTVQGKAVLKSGAAVKPGALVEVSELKIERAEFESWDKEVTVLYEDNDLIVVDKPAGVSMHPGAGQRKETLLNALVGRLSPEFLKKGADSRAGIVHRLDKDTTGVVVVAKNTKTQELLSRQFAERTVKKTYLALALSTPRSKRLINKQDRGVITGSIARDRNNRLKMAIVPDEEGRSAVTNWKVIERMNYAALLEIDLKTGRTHQIRVHFAHINSAIIGDRTYGDFSALPVKLKKAAEEFGRQALHAAELTFFHPHKKKQLTFQAKLPADMERLIDEFRAYE